MKKLTIGYLFYEVKPRREDKLFRKLSKKKKVDIMMINLSKELDEDWLEEQIKKCDIFFNNSAESLTEEIIKTIESFGKKVIDSSKKWFYDEEKWIFFLKCKKHNIPTPRTILLSENIKVALEEIKKFNSWPVVLKRVEGMRGQYVDRAENLNQAGKIIRKFWEMSPNRIPIIAQEFIDSPSYRVTTVGNKIIQTALKQNNRWKATGVYANHFKKFKVEKDLKKIVEKIIKVFGIKVCGIDLFKKEGRWIVCEINSSPGLDFFENETEMLIEKILDLIKKEAEH